MVEEFANQQNIAFRQSGVIVCQFPQKVIDEIVATTIPEKESFEEVIYI